MAAYAYYTIQDAKGDKSTVEIPFPNSTSTTTLLAQVGPIALLIRDLVTGGLVAAGIRIEMDLSATGPAGFGGWGPVASLAADVQEKARFSLRTVLGNLKSITLPTIDEDIFAPASKEVDLSDANVQAWVTFLEDGIGGIQPSDQRGEDLFVLEDASEAWGKSRK